eukprot:Lankesteria_metandrocarpae@DN4357_c0_g1_i3.p1
MWKDTSLKIRLRIGKISLVFPKKAYELLESRFLLTSSVVENSYTSSDGSTTKMILRLFDGKRVEVVLMRYGAVELSSFPEHLQRRQKDGSVEFKSAKRATLCVSSQVGCRMACTFCATGTMGHVANLTSGEILEQLYHANKIEQVRNVVFMGMGEPLDNYDEVVEAIRGMKDVRRFNLAAQHISVSTVGVPKRIRQLANDARDVSLALSLHGASQELRCKLLPCARAYPLQRILDALDYFTARQKALSQSLYKNQLILIQYILIRDVNDTEKCAHQLLSLMTERKSYIMINLIPYNPTDSSSAFESPYETSNQESVDAFIEVLRTGGLRVSVRQELGQDIGGACGQLVNKNTGEGCALSLTDDAVCCSHNGLRSPLKETIQNSTVLDCSLSNMPGMDYEDDSSTTENGEDYQGCSDGEFCGLCIDKKKNVLSMGYDLLCGRRIRYASITCFTVCMLGLFVINRTKHKLR